MLILYSCISRDKEKLDLLLKANQLLEDKDYDNAISVYNHAIELDLEFTDAYNNRGVANFENGKPALALADYNYALLLKPDYAEAMFNRSNALTELGRIEEALDDLQNLRKFYGDSSILDFSTGLAYSKSGDYSKSIAAFKTTWIKDQNNVEIPINIGTAYYYLEDFDSARFYIDKAIQLDSGHSSSYNALALIETKNQNYDRAMQFINNALDLAPDDPYLLNNRGFIHLSLCNLEESIADINNSIITDPYNGWAYRNKGLYYSKMDKMDKAIKMLQKASEMNGRIENVFFYLGEAYFKNGNLEKACEAWSNENVKNLPEKYLNECKN